MLELKSIPNHMLYLFIYIYIFLLVDDDCAWFAFQIFVKHMYYMYRMKWLFWACAGSGFAKFRVREVYLDDAPRSDNNRVWPAYVDRRDPKIACSTNMDTSNNQTGEIQHTHREHASILLIHFMLINAEMTRTVNRSIQSNISNQLSAEVLYPNSELSNQIIVNYAMHMYMYNVVYTTIYTHVYVLSLSAQPSPHSQWIGFSYNHICTGRK